MDGDLSEDDPFLKIQALSRHDNLARDATQVGSSYKTEYGMGNKEYPIYCR